MTYSPFFINPKITPESLNLTQMKFNFLMSGVAKGCHQQHNSRIEIIDAVSDDKVIKLVIELLDNEVYCDCCGKAVNKLDFYISRRDLK